jgi:hypothetical protein
MNHCDEKHRSPNRNMPEPLTFRGTDTKEFPILWADAKPGDICAEGVYSCGKDARAPIWVCDNDRQCGFLRYEHCPATSC